MKLAWTAAGATVSGLRLTILVNNERRIHRLRAAETTFSLAGLSPATHVRVELIALSASPSLADSAASTLEAWTLVSPALLLRLFVCRLGLCTGAWL